MDLSEKWMFKTGLQRHVKIAMDKAIAHVERNPHLDLADVLKADVKMETQRFITQERLKKQSFGGYNPGGMAMPNRNLKGDYRYGYQGQEVDPETGKPAFELRLYDPRINRWLTTDPAGQHASPYLSMSNNWVNSVDPDGGYDNPIYDSDGNFRGVDEFGLQGEAIIYDGEFSNGMSQSSILGNGGTFLSDYAFNLPGDQFAKFDDPTWRKVFSHSYDLRKRPDYDGVLTLDEANSWFRNGNGQPLFVDASKIDLFPVTTAEFNEANPRYYNFFTDGVGSMTTGRVYGTIRLTLLDIHGKVRLGGNNGHLDTYDFDIKDNPNNNLKVGFRNFGTRVGGAFAGDGTKFRIFNYGFGRVRIE